MQAANSSPSPLVRRSDWHNQVTTELKGRGHQQELASSISYVNRLWIRCGGRNKKTHVAVVSHSGTHLINQERLPEEIRHKECLLRQSVVAREREGERVGG